MEQPLYRTTLLVCCVLSCGVLANLFLVQRGTPSLAVSTSGAPPGQVSTEGGRTPPRPKAGRPAGVVAPDLIRAIQRELHAKGYITRAPDGALDMSTRAAIWAWESDNGLQPSAAPSEDVLKALLLGAAISRNAPAAAQPESVTLLIRHVQMLLKTRRGSDLQVTGRFDRATRRAISVFERQHGLAETGKISAVLVLRLENAGLHGR